MNAHPCWVELVWSRLPAATVRDVVDLARRLRRKKPTPAIETFGPREGPLRDQDNGLSMAFAAAVSALLQVLAAEQGLVLEVPRGQRLHGAVDVFGQASASLVVWHGQRGAVSLEGVCLRQGEARLVGLALLQDGHRAREGTSLWMLEGRLLAFLATFLTALDAALTEEHRTAIGQLLHEAAQAGLASAGGEA